MKIAFNKASLVTFAVFSASLWQWGVLRMQFCKVHLSIYWILVLVGQLALVSYIGDQCRPVTGRIQSPEEKRSETVLLWGQGHWITALATEQNVSLSLNICHSTDMIYLVSFESSLDIQKDLRFYLVFFTIHGHTQWSVGKFIWFTL